MFLNRNWYGALICLCGFTHLFNKISQGENNAEGHGLYYSDYTPSRQGAEEFSMDISSISTDNWQIEQ